MDLNKLITKRIKEYALDGDVDLLDKYGFLFNMIAKDYAEAINYTHCCESGSELLKVLEYTRQVKNNPKEIQLIVDKLYIENL